MFSSALHLEPNFCARVIKKKEGNATAIKNRASAVHIHKRFQGSLADTVLDVFQPDQRVSWTEWLPRALLPVRERLFIKTFQMCFYPTFPFTIWG